MRIKLFNKPKFQLYCWTELSAGLAVVGGLAFSLIPF